MNGGLASRSSASLMPAFARSFRLVMGVAALFAAGCVPTSFLITPVAASPTLEEFVVQRESIWAAKRIAIIELEGVISNRRSTTLLGLSEPNPVVEFKERLDAAAADDRVKAVVLRINSPGGGVTASDMMYQELLSFRQRTAKPVIACMMDVAASGGYYVACGADEIYAQPTTVTGSVGVIMLTLDVSKGLDYIGVRPNVIKSGAMKDAGSPFREMRDEDRKVFQSMIDQMYERFLNVVARARKSIPPDDLRKLCDGRVFLADDARQLGLIDGVGTLGDAILAAKRAARIERRKVVVVQYGRSLSYRPNIYAHQPAPPGTVVNQFMFDVPSWLAGGGPEFMYLWKP
ncbi:MAG: signal peptide peptidase SppA [Phycisphaerales bacterium]|nr:signal peptide peptidase SppA [Phycisphaerales bacterium]